MSKAMDQLAAQIQRVREELAELEGTLTNWDTGVGASKTGSKEARAIMGRILASTKNLEQLVRQHSFD